MDDRYKVVWRTHIGLVRNINEDRVLANAEQGVFAVSDGMGGHARGDIAAQMVVDALSEVTASPRHDETTEASCQAIERANKNICERALQQSLDASMGTTVAALIISDFAYSCIWVGDSRIYLMRDNRLIRLTTDHSVTQDLIDRKVIQESERNSHPQASVITRAVGISSSLDISRAHGRAQSNDLFFICTDGICGMLNDDEIARILSESDESKAANCFIEAVIKQGAKDNLSFLMVRQA